MFFFGMRDRQITRAVEQRAPVNAPSNAAAAWMAATWVAAALLAVLSLFVLSGCTWTGKGKDVADALKKTAAVKTAVYSGSMQMQTNGDAGNQGMEITFSGASDNSNRAAPRSSMDMTVAGTRMLIVMPGDGNIYVGSPAGMFGAPVDAAESQSAQNNYGAVLTALEPAIGNFREGAANTTNEGLSLRTIAADGNVGKICDTVVPAFSSYMDTASSNGGALKGLAGDKSLSDLCRTMLVKKPTLWFGIDNAGLLRMISLKASMSMMALGSVDLTMRFDLTSVNEPLKIVAPRGARMYSSQQQLVQSLGSSGS